jgi:hypothetical protein
MFKELITLYVCKVSGSILSDTNFGGLIHTEKALALDEAPENGRGIPRISRSLGRISNFKKIICMDIVRPLYRCQCG